MVDDDYCLDEGKDPLDSSLWVCFPMAFQSKGCQVLKSAKIAKGKNEESAFRPGMLGFQTDFSEHVRLFCYYGFYGKT
jgi:hypothetical protein